MDAWNTTLHYDWFGAINNGNYVWLPKLTKKLPEALIAILVVSAIVIFGKLDVATVGSFIRDGGGEGLKGGLPHFQWDIFNKVPFNLETLKFICLML